MPGSRPARHQQLILVRPKEEVTMPDIIERNAECARQLLEAGAEIERLRELLRWVGVRARVLPDDDEKELKRQLAHIASLANERNQRS
jgi:hypothetical protein